jgi:hypothetical protein
MQKTNCNPCWSYNIGIVNGKLQCFVHQYYNHKKHLCPCRICLIRTTCTTRCEKRRDIPSWVGKREDELQRM